MSSEYTSTTKEMSQNEERIEFEGGNENYDWPVEKIMRQLVRQNLHLNQDVVYSKLAQELPELDVIDKVLEDYGKVLGTEMVRRVKEDLGDNYIKLLIEPSLGTRLDEFLEFAKTFQIQGELPPPAELRLLFKESLGKKQVYRAGAFTTTQLEEIRAKGFVANYYRSKTREEILSNKDGYESIEYNLSDLRGRVNVHAGGFAKTEGSTLISVSDFSEMAQFAAFVQLKYKWQELKSNGYNFYVIPTEVNEFDCIRYGKYLPHHIDASGVWASPQKEITYNDAGIESFIEFSIPPQNIDWDNVKSINIDDIPKFVFVSDEK